MIMKHFLKPLIFRFNITPSFYFLILRTASADYMKETISELRILRFKEFDLLFGTNKDAKRLFRCRNKK